MLSLIALLLAGLSFLAFGLAILFHPVETMAAADVVLSDARAVVEVRAFYGGLEIALGLLLLACLPQERRRYGLLLGAVAFSGIAFARAFGMLMSSTTSNFLWIALGVELFTAALCLAGLRFERQSAKKPE